MFIEIIIAIITGMLCGVVTGLTPGIHINLISLLMVGFAGLVSGINPFFIAITIISMGITHSFLDSIPSTFLGCPDSDMALSALPAHKLLLEGRGKEAIKLTTIGSLLCLVLTCVFILFTINYIKIVYEFIQPFIGFILLGVILFIILKQGTVKQKFMCLFLFLLSGIFGIIVLNFPNLRQPLLPMFSGMFGISTLLLSLNQTTNLPEQNNEQDKLDKKITLKALFAGVFSGSLTGLFPGLGSAQAGVLGSTLTGNIGGRGYLILTGGINTVNFLFSLATFFILGKARNGAIVAVSKIIESITFEQMLLFLVVALLVGGISSFLAIFLAKGFSKFVVKVDYQKLCLSIMLLISLIVMVFSGFVGMIILVFSTFIGLIAPLANIPRSSAMGCLLIPVILFFII